MSDRRRLEVEAFVIDFGSRTLERDGERIAMRPKTFALLEHLVRHAGRLVTKAELLAAVWPDVSVTDTVLKVCVRELRAALGDDPRRPTFIETRHRVGYTFIAPLRASNAAGPRAGAVRPLVVGRERELEMLAEALERVQRGEPGPRVCVLSGEAGLGKSALVEAFAREAGRASPHLAWCSGTCIEQHGVGEALFPFLEGLGALAAAESDIREQLRTLAPTWCLHLPAMFSADDQLNHDALGATHPRMLRELGAVLAALPPQRSLLWILEDMHWADTASIDLLRYLGSACRNERVLFVTTMRQSLISAGAHPLDSCLLELTAHDHARHIVLGPLTGDAVGAYLEHVLAPHAVEPRWFERIGERTEGHPLFLTSLVQHLLDTGGFVRGDDGLARAVLDLDALAQAVPANVDAMVARRLTSLDDAARRTLAHASVQGTSFATDVLAATLEEDPAVVEERLDTLFRVDRLLASRAELTSERSTALEYHFTHGLYRDALYAEIPPTRRAALHSAVAKSLSADAGHSELQAIAASLAAHYELGGELSLALQHLRVLVGNSERRLALADADEACARALRLVERLPATERPQWLVLFHERRASLHGAAGRFREATNELEAMRRWARAAGDVESEIAALLHTFRQLGYLGRFQDAEAVASEAAELADDATRSEIDASTAALRGVRGELAAACEGLESAFERLRRAGKQPNAANLLDHGAFQSMRGLYAEAGPYLERTLALVRESGDALRVGAGLFWRAHSFANLGRMTPAFEALNEALRLAERNDDVFVLPRLLAAAAWMRRELGAFDEARRFDERAIGEREGPVAASHAHGLLSAASTELALGNLTAVDAIFERVATVLHEPFFDHWLIRVRLEDARARWALAAGDLEGAETWVATLAASAAKHDLGKRRARAQLLSAEIQLRKRDHRACAARLDELASSLRDRPAVLLEWRAWALRARLADAEGNEEAATAARGAGEDVVRAILDGTPEALHASFRRMVTAAGL